MADEHQTRPVAHSPSEPRLHDELVKLALAGLAPGDFFREFLRRVLDALTLPTGTVWTRNEVGDFVQQGQLNPGKLDLELEGQARTLHDDLLRQAIQSNQPIYAAPQGEPGEDFNGELANVGIWVLPLFFEGKVHGLLEVWSRPEEGNLLGGALIRVTDIAQVYWHHQKQLDSDRQETWNRIDAFARRIHSSLQPTEVAFLVANEGRQLVGCDRLSVALKHGRKAKIEALSGVEKADQRSNLLKRMRRLCDRVIAWGEPLRFRGERDDTLPPVLLKELDSYLEESHSKQLVILPLHDEREKKVKKPARSALVMESFATTEPLEVLEERLKVVGGHAASALYNASSYRQVPMRFLWLPIAKVQEGLGGKTKAIIYSVAAALLILIFCLIFVPYPLKMDSKGQLLPQNRQWVYSPVEGKVVRFEEGVEPAALVRENQDLLLLFDVQLESKLTQLAGEATSANQKARALASQVQTATTEADRLRLSADQQEQEALRERKLAELNSLRRRTNSDVSRPGHFYLKSPLTGTVLNHGFRETLTDRQVRPSEPLLRVGDKDGPWEIELRIPQKHIGQVVQGFKTDDLEEELEVDLLVISAPTRTFKGRLSRAKLAGEARPNTEEAASDAEPVVVALVRIEGDDIPDDQRIPNELLVAGTEVRAKVRCGDRAMGYSLFYGVWEFIYEKVVFWF